MPEAAETHLVEAAAVEIVRILRLRLHLQKGRSAVDGSHTAGAGVRLDATAKLELRAVAWSQWRRVLKSPG